jgi:hypothetical protein
LDRAAQDEVSKLIARIVDENTPNFDSDVFETTVSGVLKGKLEDIIPSKTDEVESNETIKIQVENTASSSPNSSSSKDNSMLSFTTHLNLSLVNLHESFRDVVTSFYAHASTMQQHLLDSPSPCVASIEGLVRCLFCFVLFNFVYLCIFLFVDFLFVHFEMFCFRTS